jgi:hypothetical protein
MHEKLQAAQAAARLIQQQYLAVQLAAAGTSGEPAAKQAKRNRWDK